MNDTQFIITVLILSLSVCITRALPFLVFRDTDKLPSIIEYLGKVLPAAMMGLLVVYCFKDYDFNNISATAPALIAALLVAVLHIWKKNMVLSITAGTLFYMVLIRML